MIHYTIEREGDSWAIMQGLRTIAIFLTLYQTQKRLDEFTNEEKDLEMLTKEERMSVYLEMFNIVEGLRKKAEAARKKQRRWESNYSIELERQKINLYDALWNRAYLMSEGYRKTWEIKKEQ
jgi:hypothetical protein